MGFETVLLPALFKIFYFVFPIRTQKMISSFVLPLKRRGLDETDFERIRNYFLNA